MNNAVKIVVISGEEVGPEKGTQVASIVSLMSSFLWTIFLGQMQQNAKLPKIWVVG